MLANQHVRFGERVTGDPTRGNRSLLDRRARGVGWERLPHLFLPNYGCSASRSYAPSTQNADYGGVEEAARFQPKRSVTIVVFPKMCYSCCDIGNDMFHLYIDR